MENIARTHEGNLKYITTKRSKQHEIFYTCYEMKYYYILYILLNI